MKTTQKVVSTKSSLGNKQKPEGASPSKSLAAPRKKMVKKSKSLLKNSSEMQFQKKLSQSSSETKHSVDDKNKSKIVKEMIPSIGKSTSSLAKASLYSSPQKNSSDMLKGGKIVDNNKKMVKRKKLNNVASANIMAPLNKGLSNKNITGENVDIPAPKKKVVPTKVKVAAKQKKSSKKEINSASENVPEEKVHSIPAKKDYHKRVKTSSSTSTTNITPKIEVATEQKVSSVCIFDDTVKVSEPEGKNKRKLKGSLEQEIHLLKKQKLEQKTKMDKNVKISAKKSKASPEDSKKSNKQANIGASKINGVIKNGPKLSKTDAKNSGKLTRPAAKKMSKHNRRTTIKHSSNLPPEDAAAAAERKSVQRKLEAFTNPLLTKHRKMAALQEQRLRSTLRRPGYGGLRVRNMTHGTTQQQLGQLLRPHGRILILAVDASNKDSKQNYATAYFSEPDAAVAAAKLLHQTVLGDRVISASYLAPHMLKTRMFLMRRSDLQGQLAV